MKNFEELTKMNWFDYLLLKSIGDERKSTPEIIQSFAKNYAIYSPVRRVPDRSYFTRRLEFLIDLGLVVKEKGVINFYEIKPIHKKSVTLLLVGLFFLYEEGIQDVKK